MQISHIFTHSELFKNIAPASIQENIMFINASIDYCKMKFKYNDHLFLNDVYDIIGVERTHLGAIIGWTKHRSFTPHISVVYKTNDDQTQIESVTFIFDYLYNIINTFKIDSEKCTFYYDIMDELFLQLPHLKFKDIKPNGRNQLYIWLKESPVNLIATYYPSKRIFAIETTYDEWALTKVGKDI